MSECVSIVRAGFARRLRVSWRYWFPAVLLAEAAVVVYVLGSVVDGARVERTITTYPIVKDEIHFQTAWFAGFALALLVVMFILAWGAIRSARKVRASSGGGGTPRSAFRASRARALRLAPCSGAGASLRVSWSVSP
jgi:hypothetical protein